jgi:hypothetical protein
MTFQFQFSPMFFNEEKLELEFGLLSELKWKWNGPQPWSLVQLLFPITTPNTSLFYSNVCKQSKCKLTL